MGTTQAKAADVYGRTYELDEQTLEVMVTRLEARGRHPVFIQSIGDYGEQLRLSGTESLLELGCGTGVASRRIALRPDAPGRIVALDISPHLVAAASRLAAAEGLDGRIDWRVGDAHALGLDEQFDVVLLHTLISHVADPERVLHQAVGHLTPGSGRMVVFDADVASLSIATEAEDGGAESDRLIRKGLFAQPRAVRSLPRLLRERGMQLAWSRAYAVADIGRPDYFGPLLASLPILLPKAGVMSEQEARRFVDELGVMAARDAFFGVITFHTIIAHRVA
ncbi:methyltransferase domain-containing protein [Elioraea rosea]|uniref:methyltransferase domain-containing protein n=1 Tax=Elioraea rosea TaxID=2492390 RepID=UPI001184E732|nr:methyltransferase domain-containing protein [Elioraea rosea]